MNILVANPFLVGSVWIGPHVVYATETQHCSGPSHVGVASFLVASGMSSAQKSASVRFFPISFTLMINPH